MPLLAAVGVASLVSEYAEGIFSQQFEQALTSIYFRDKLLFWGANAAGGGSIIAAPADNGTAAEAGGNGFTAVSRSGSPIWGFGSSAIAGFTGGGGGSSGGTGSSSGSGSSAPVTAAVKQQLTVEAIIATPARLYVRHTLPLEQAKEALLVRSSAAAVVVDDDFTPMGIVYLEDIEAELVKQELLNEPDANFDRPAQ